MPKRVVIDGRMWSWTGVGRYTQRLLGQLPKLDTEHTYQVLLLKKDWDKWRPPAQNFSKVEADFLPYTLDEQHGLLRLLRKLSPDLVHFPAINQPLHYRGKKLTTVHDLTLVEYKNIRDDRWRYELKFLAFKFLARRVVKSADHIITDAAFVKRQLVERYRKDPLEITPIHLAGERLAAKAAPYPGLAENTPFILYVGNAYPYKNLWLLIEAFASLRDQQPDLQLVLVGKTEFFYQQLQKQVREQQIAGVVFTDFVPDEQLVWLYQHARAYVFPSWSEGFGLPGLEAMHYGLPVIASRASCLPEIYGEAALYFDPGSSRELTRQISKLLASAELRSTLQAKATQQLGRYSWQKMAEETLTLYNQLLTGL